jgi:diguanylate cyclase (GGDEF)-like protein
MGPRRDGSGSMTTPEVALNSAVADRIIALLERGPQDPAGWRASIHDMEREWGEDVYTVLLFILSHLDFPREKAHEQWGRILRQWEALNASIPDGVDLRVAVLHYFLRIQRRLRNPAIVELKILRQTQDSAIYDELTRLHNYRYFQDRVTAEVRRAERYASPLTLLMIDADDFKAFNDTHGHLAGNVALRRLAGVLRRSVREADVVARYGGEEFAILLPSTPKLAALKVGEKVRQAVEKAAIGSESGPEAKGLTVSIGVASLPGDATDIAELVDRADRALYIAKSMGKNCVKPFSDERREYARIDAVLPGQYSAVESAAHPLTTLNVSEEGILFHSAEPLVSGTVVRVQLALPPSGEPIECVVRVLRVIGARGGFEIGAHIVHMPRIHERRFRLFLKALKAGELVPMGGNGGNPPPKLRRGARGAATA